MRSTLVSRGANIISLERHFLPHNNGLPCYAIAVFYTTSVYTFILIWFPLLLPRDAAGTRFSSPIVGIHRSVHHVIFVPLWRDIRLGACPSTGIFIFQRLIKI
jgi:hypothetical protein